jgi:antitoxin (DNA-binding transcriptional repressor) of toxin-antitoxin stability system
MHSGGGGGMKVANTVELKNKTNQLLRMVMKGEAVINTHRGKPAASLTALTEDDLDDFVLEHSPRIKKMVADAEVARLKGDVVSLEDYLRSR